MTTPSFNGPYANSERAPLMGHLKCSCPLTCRLHGDKGYIPGDQTRPAQYPDGHPKAQNSDLDPMMLQALDAPVDGEVIVEPEPGAVVTPKLLSTVHTPASIIPVEVENASEILAEAGLKLEEEGEDIVIAHGDGYHVRFHYEVANALCQEVLKVKKRIELTLPETLEITIETLKKRAGHDMAPLIDKLEQFLKTQKQ